MPTYRTRFQVSPLRSSRFPIDMLRYDGCHPESEQESYRISSTFPPHHEVPKEPVLLEKLHPEKDPHLTDARWQSFGWGIVDGSVRTERV